MDEARPGLGEQELEVLQYIAEHAPVTSREAAEHFWSERQLARTTVLTVIERLRKKGYVVRNRKEGVFHYRPREAQADVLQRIVRQFVEKTLSGSVSPMVAYLVQSRRLSEEDLAALQQLVDTMKSQQGRDKQ